MKRGGLKTVGLIEAALLCLHQSRLQTQWYTSLCGYIILLHLEYVNDKWKCHPFELVLIMIQNIFEIGNFLLGTAIISL